MTRCLVIRPDTFIDQTIELVILRVYCVRMTVAQPKKCLMDLMSLFAVCLIKLILSKRSTTYFVKNNTRLRDWFFLSRTRDGSQQTYFYSERSLTTAE